MTTEAIPSNVPGSTGKSGATGPNGKSGGGRSNRHRNRNRNGGKSMSRSPSHDSSDDGGAYSGAGSGDERARTKQNGGPNRRHGNKSKSPTRQQGNKSRSPTRSHNRRKHKKNGGYSCDISVICNRRDLWDSAARFLPEDGQSHPHQPHPETVKPYYFAPDNPSLSTRPVDIATLSVAVARVPHHFDKNSMPTLPTEGGGRCGVVDTDVPNPHDSSVVHDKYWAQRRRLFARFDQGIQLDAQGWYSVTPEIIADHVASRVCELATSHVVPHNSSEGIVVLDAFCGCGGNSIAFGKVASNLISKVVCVDTDRSKLLKAAHNAALYDIPKDKVVFVECNSVFLLQHCYRNGEFVLDQPTASLPPYMPPPVMPTTHAGYRVGGLDLLPRRIDAVFMDPPWGGVDYELLGKHGYDLQKNMSIEVAPPPPEHDDYQADGDGCDDFFDNFTAAPKPQKHKSQKARKANFNKHTEGHFIDGMELLRIAAEATQSRVVVFDLPRNTNKVSLGKCALGAGYRGNLKLEEHYLNGRLKTVTAYLGADFSDLMNDLQEHHTASGTSGDEA